METSISAQHSSDTPLLSAYSCEVVVEGPDEEQQNSVRHVGFWGCVANLAKVILGAGVMAMPKALFIAGGLLGSILLVLIALLSWYTVAGLALGAEKQRVHSYGLLTDSVLGRAMCQALQLSVVTTCVGYMVVYNDILLDILLGANASGSSGAELSRGILHWIIPVQWCDTVWLSRPVVLAALTLFVLAPNVLRRSMSHLAAVNLMGLLSLLAFATVMVWLAVAAVLHGVSHPLPLGPNLPALGPSLTQQLIRASCLVPVIFSANSCHHAVIPAMTLLKPYNDQSMRRVIAWAVGGATIIYAIVSVSANIAFGPSIEEDVLNNLSTTVMTPLIGEWCAVAVAGGIRAAYLVALVGNAILMMFPLRVACVELLVGHHMGEVHARAKYVMTAVLLAIVYAITVWVPSIWDMIVVVSSFSQTIICFIVPGAIIYVIRDKRTWAHCWHRVLGLVVSVLGGLLLLNGFATAIIGIEASS